MARDLKVINMVNQNLGLRVLRISLIISFIIILSICLCILAYFVVYRQVDEATCLHRVANRIEIEPTYSDLRFYIQSTLAPGMTRIEVQDILEKIGPIDVKTDNEILNNMVADRIWLKACSHPLNHILIYTRYTPEGKLISIKIVDD